MRVVAPPDRTTTTEFDPDAVPGQSRSAGPMLLDWDESPDACATAPMVGLRADLTGDGEREYVTYIDGTSEDGLGTQVLRICAGDHVWERTSGNTSLLTVLRVGDRWYVAWGGTSGRGRHQTLLAIVDGELIDVVDEGGEPVRLDEGEPSDDPMQITRWWGCEDDVLARAEREAGTPRWTVTRYEWDPDGRHMVQHSTEVRIHDPLTVEPTSDGGRSYSGGVNALSDVLPPACEGADDWGRGGVPRLFDAAGYPPPSWLGWPRLPRPFASG